MAGYSGTLAAQVMALLTSTASGINSRITSIEANDSTLKGAGIRSFVAQNVSAAVAESAGQAQYPCVLVYCESVQNLQREKSRDFSGRVHMVIEIRQTQQTLAAIDQNTEMYVDAVCALLGEAQGQWGDGASYSGGYEVEYEPVTMGGKNFLQRAKINFAVELSE
jgi:hypothetical protein